MHAGLLIVHTLANHSTNRNHLHSIVSNCYDPKQVYCFYIFTAKCLAFKVLFKPDSSSRTPLVDVVM